MLGGCFDPQPPAGSPCPTNALCPSPLVCSAATNTCEPKAEDSIDAGPGDDADASNLPSFAELDGQQWLMPCKAAPNPTLCDCDDVMTRFNVGGDTAETYDVTVRIRGLMERGTYSGGTGDGAWYVGGATTSTFLTVAELRVSSPPQHYFLNNVPSQSGLPMLDYEATLPITGGAQITLYFSALDGREIPSSTTIPGVTTVPSPYQGQFAQINVVRVMLAP